MISIQVLQRFLRVQLGFSGRTLVMSRFADESLAGRTLTRRLEDPQDPVISKQGLGYLSVSLSIYLCFLKTLSIRAVCF